MKDTIHRSSGDIFLDLGFSAAEAEPLLMRAELMEAPHRLIEGRGWAQTEAAECLGIGQSQVSDLVRGKWKKFSVDTLVSLALRAGLRPCLPRSNHGTF